MVYKYNRKTEKMDLDRLSDAIEAVKNADLTIKAASKVLNVDRNTLRKYLRNGIPSKVPTQGRFHTVFNVDHADLSLNE